MRPKANRFLYRTLIVYFIGVVSSFNSLFAAPTDIVDVAGLLARGEFDQALQEAEKRLARARQEYGEDSVQAARGHYWLAEALMENQHWVDARLEPSLSSSLNTFRAHLGKAHPEIVPALLARARFLVAKDKYQEAEQTAQKAVEIREKNLGVEHPDTAEAMFTVAHAQNSRERSGAAVALARRAIEILESAGDMPSRRGGRMLVGLATIVSSKGEHAKGLEIGRRALDMLRRVSGEGHPDVVHAMTRVALFHYRREELRQALEISEQAIALGEKSLGKEHVILHDVYYKAGMAANIANQPLAARRYFDMALRTKAKAFGEYSNDVASVLSDLSLLFSSLGDVDGAIAHIERALEIGRKTLPRGSLHLAAYYGNLAVAQMSADHIGDAEQNVRAALAEMKLGAGEDHFVAAVFRSWLGEIFHHQGNFEKAREIMDRALPVLEERFGSSHRYVLSLLSARARLAHDMGEFDEAQRRYEEALARDESTGGTQNHIRVSLKLGLSKLWYDRLRAELSFDWAHNAWKDIAEFRDLAFAGLTEAEALEMMEMSDRSLDLMLSAAAQVPPAKQIQVWDLVIRNRGRVLDEIAARTHELRESTDERSRELFAAVKSARNKVATLAVRQVQASGANVDMSKLTQAREKLQFAERALAEHNAFFRETRKYGGVGYEQVRVAMDKGDTLVAFVRYTDLGRLGQKTGSGRDKGELRYMAFVLDAEARVPRLHTLGTANNIEARIERWRAEIATANRSATNHGTREAIYRAAAVRLRKSVWDPLTQGKSSSGRWFIVPDGATSLLNFATFPVADERYLAETGPTLHYLTSERDLVLTGQQSAQGTGMLALGAPTFDLERNSNGLLDLAFFRGPRASCAEFREHRFAELARSADEVEHVTQQFFADQPRSEVVKLLGADASESAFRNHARGKSILHLATHGFILGEECLERSAYDGLADRSTLGVSGNGFILSGLAVAGANNREGGKSVEDDGILTAQEISTLDLSATQWVVLSACGSGIGHIVDGEGVFGLRRAFRIAGAKTIIMSLWSVRDDVADVWMKALYDARFGEHLDTLSSIEQANRMVLAQRRAAGVSTHPAFWGAFVGVGDWR